MNLCTIKIQSIQLYTLRGSKVTPDHSVCVITLYVYVLYIPFHLCTSGKNNNKNQQNKQS